MLLGSLLSGLQSPAYAATLIEETGDLLLLARIEQAGRAFDESPGDYAANAVARFSQSASDEDWLALMTALEKSDAPASTCLGRMVHWALDKDAAELAPATGACSCGGQGGCHEPG